MKHPFVWTLLLALVLSVVFDSIAPAIIIVSLLWIGATAYTLVFRHRHPCEDD